MTSRIPVLTTLAGYRVAVAGLPIQAQPARDATGAIVVIDGAASWWDAAALAIRDGASAVLVAEPNEVPIDAVGDLAANAPVPILVHRSRLRADLVERAVEQRAGVAPRVVVAECRASADGLEPVVRDAIGWVRVFADARLVVASASAAAGGAGALLRSRADGIVVGSMLVTVTRPDGAVLRVQALGETTTEVEIDEPVGRSELSTSTERGRWVAPGRFESGERMALRRAISAVEGTGLSQDLVDLLHDGESAARILRGEHWLRRFS